MVGVEGMRSWWQLDGKWPKDDSDQGIIGKTLATELGVTTGDTVTLNKTTASGKKNEQKITLTGVYDSGDEDNGRYTSHPPSLRYLPICLIRWTRSRSRP